MHINHFDDATRSDIDWGAVIMADGYIVTRLRANQDLRAATDQILSEHIRLMPAHMDWMKAEDWKHIQIIHSIQRVLVALERLRAAAPDFD